MTKFFLLFSAFVFINNACYTQTIQDSIVLINIGPYNKQTIAKEIEIVNALNPKVISLDVALPHFSGDRDDMQLYRALQETRNLIMPSKITSEGKDYNGKEIISVSLAGAIQFFPFRNAKAGFVSAKKTDNNRQIPKDFIVWQEGYSGDIYYHFSVETAKAFDSLRTISFIKDNDRLVDIDLKDMNRRFKTFSCSDVLKGKLTKNDIEGKIVMMGFLGPGNEDKFYSSVEKM